MAIKFKYSDLNLLGKESVSLNSNRKGRIAQTELRGLENMASHLY